MAISDLSKHANQIELSGIYNYKLEDLFKKMTELNKQGDYKNALDFADVIEANFFTDNGMLSAHEYKKNKRFLSKKK